MQAPRLFDTEPNTRTPRSSASSTSTPGDTHRLQLGDAARHDSDITDDDTVKPEATALNDGDVADD
jgi:hypothetical protein